MRSRHLAFVLLAALAPASALARSWQGITPGQSTQGDVTGRFGEPSTKGRLEGRTAMVYKGDQAIGGTRQAQFLVGENGVISEINVFPSTQLDKESVEGTYGKSPQKTFTDDFRPVWIYRSVGVMVFFGKDGLVEAIRFEAPRGTAAAAPPPQKPSTPPLKAATPPAKPPAGAR